MNGRDRPIVFVTPYYPPFGAGGAEYTTSLHAQILVGLKREVIVVTPNYGGDADDTMSNGVRVLRYPYLRLPGEGSQVPARSLYGPRHQKLIESFLLERLRRINPLCLHAQHSYSTVGAWHAARKIGVPFIGHVRDTTMICSLGAICMTNRGVVRPPRRCGLAQHVRCSADAMGNSSTRLNAMLGKYRVVWPFMNFHWRRRALQDADRVAFASSALLEMHAGLDDFPARSRLKVVYAPATEIAETTGVLPDPVRDLVERSIPFILYVGKVSRGKGLDVLFRSHKLVLEKMPDVRLVIAGNIHGEDWDFDRERTLLLGHVRRDQLPSIYRSCAVVAVPSTWPEPLGWGTLDAGRFKRPIVATRVGGIPEAIIDGETGILVPPSEPDDMAGAFLAILADPDRARQMGLAGYQNVSNRFGPVAVGSQLNGLYEGL